MKPEVSYDSTGYQAKLLGKVPVTGKHPRLLFSEEEIPDIKNRLANTIVGQRLSAITQRRLEMGLLKDHSWTDQCVKALGARDFEQYEFLQKDPKPAEKESYNQTPVLYDLQLGAFHALLNNDEQLGKKVAAAVAGWALHLEPKVEQWRSSPYPDNAGRWGSFHALGSYGLFSWHQLGYAYDLAQPFMSEEETATTRRVISKITNGAYFFGMNLPPQLRMWNWVHAGHCFTLLSMSIEGEEGHDPRVEQLAEECLQDYILYNYSKKGSSTEPVGYTSFGWLWGGQAAFAFARRGNPIFTTKRYREISRWHVQCLTPYGGHYVSHGDGGDRSPTQLEVMLMKYLYPEDHIIDYDYQQLVKKYFGNDKLDRTKDHQLIFESVIACDPEKNEDGSLFDHEFGKKLGLETTWMDPERGTMISRTGWDKDAFYFNYECRPDSFYAGHEHADRGVFNIAALGRGWTLDGFRSVQSRYHNIVLVDGRGQGYFTPPGKVLQMTHHPKADFAVCDIKYAYDWFWPKAILGTDLNDDKFKAERFQHFKEQAESFQQNHSFELDPHPNVKAAFEGFELGDSGMWDEDSWSIRSPFNPVEYAYRTAGLVKGDHPYALIIDDIQKDQEERLYEWIMMLEDDLIPIKIDLHDNATGVGLREKKAATRPYTDIVLGSDSIRRKGNRRFPKKGEPLLLVRFFELAFPEKAADYTMVPQARVETFEKKDMITPGGRTFGMSKRLVVPSRSKSPRYKVMIYPYRHRLDTLPETNWQGESITIKINNQIDTLSFEKAPTGRSLLELKRGSEILFQSESIE